MHDASSRKNSKDLAGTAHGSSRRGAVLDRRAVPGLARPNPSSPPARLLRVRWRRLCDRNRRLRQHKLGPPRRGAGSRLEHTSRSPNARGRHADLHVSRRYALEGNHCARCQRRPRAAPALWAERHANLLRRRAVRPRFLPPRHERRKGGYLRHDLQSRRRCADHGAG